MNFDGSSELLNNTRIAIVAEEFELSRYPQWDSSRPLGLRPVCGLVTIQSLEMNQMKKAVASAVETDRARQIDDFVVASLLLDEWLDWMSSLSGQG